MGGEGPDVPTIRVASSVACFVARSQLRPTTLLARCAWGIMLQDVDAQYELWMQTIFQE